MAERSVVIKRDQVMGIGLSLVTQVRPCHISVDPFAYPDPTLPRPLHIGPNSHHAPVICPSPPHTPHSARALPFPL